LDPSPATDYRLTALLNATTIPELHEVLFSGPANRMSHKLKGCAQPLMTSIQLTKLDQYPEVRKYLQQTGNRTLVETAPLDHYWGAGLSEDDVWSQERQARKKGRSWWPPYGTNIMGKILEELRRAYGDTKKTHRYLLVGDSMLSRVRLEAEVPGLVMVCWSGGKTATITALLNMLITRDTQVAVIHVGTNDLAMYHPKDPRALGNPDPKDGATRAVPYQQVSARIEEALRATATMWMAADREFVLGFSQILPRHHDKPLKRKQASPGHLSGIQTAVGQVNQRLTENLADLDHVSTIRHHPGLLNPHNFCVRGTEPGLHLNAAGARLFAHSLRLFLRSHGTSQL
jgi:predicted NAD-dependent protein-ADP-ribosyltransferase YbiA (DUF1768 family)